jgi:YbbR domain-containing protein
VKKTNILIWILSLLIAVVLWGYVAFAVNPESDKTVAGIPVEFINERELSNRDLILVDGGASTVDVRFSGRFQNLMKVNSTTVTAIVDLRQITTAGETMLEFVLEGDDIAYLDAYPIRSTVSVITDRLVFSDHLGISIDFAGEVAEGYERDPAIFSPPSIQFHGPSKEIETIHSVVVRYEPLTPLERSVNDRSVSYSLFTKDGGLIESAHITDNLTDDLKMTIPVTINKYLFLKLEPIPGGGLSDADISLRVLPESVLVAGDPDELLLRGEMEIGKINLANLEEFYDAENDRYTGTVPVVYHGVKNLDGTDTAEWIITILERP